MFNFPSWSLWLLAVALLGCATPVSDYPYDKEPDPRASEYIIGVSDGLEISVWKNGDLNTSTVVRPDGTITMPLVGDIKAVNLTPSQLRDAIKQRLAAYLKEEDAVVTVAVSGINSYYVTVAGNVVRPGRFNSQTYLTVADAIALAGGPNRFAAPSESSVLRSNPDGSRRQIPVNYDLVKMGKSLEQNVVLIRGDQVFVP